MTRILFVEDDPLVRHGLGRVLTAAGHEVRACPTQHDALAAWQAFDPELALLDIGLPDGSGVDCARRLRAAGYAGALVFLTAQGERQQVDEALAVGPHAYLVKPLTGAQLLPALEAALHAARAAAHEKQALLGALRDSREISAAVGVLAERHGCTTEAAFERLRARARAEGRRVTDVAAQVLADASARGADRP